MKKRQYKKSSKHSRKSPQRGKKSYKKHSVKNLKRGHKNSNKIALHRRNSRGRVRHGGSCGCGVMKGGMVSSPAAGPVGYSWDGGNEASWPGAAASQGLDTQGAAMSNHFKVSPNGIVVGGIDPYAGSSGMAGGKKRKGTGKRKGQKGGFFQEIVNLGRGAQYGVNGGYFNLVGKQQPISQNPFPTQEQPIDSDYKFIGATPPNVRSMYVNANNQVAGV